MKMIEGESASGNLPTAEGELVEEVWLEDLAQTDYLVIRTKNDAYRFKIIDFERQGGILSGGRLNNKPLRATLISYRRKPAAGAPERCPALRVGLGATFEVCLPEGKGQVITSPVTQMVVVRVNGQSSRNAPRLPESTFALRWCATCGFVILLKFAETGAAKEQGRFDPFHLPGVSSSPSITGSNN